MGTRMAWPSSTHWRSPRHARLAWALAWLALLLNAIAPVIAYASLGVRHQHDQPVATTDAHVAGHPAHHAHHPGNHAQHSGHVDIADAAPVQSTVAHCQYCFDFTAGAPLSIALPDGDGQGLAPSAAPFHLEAAFPAKPLLRLAYARGPPPVLA